VDFCVGISLKSENGVFEAPFLIQIIPFRIGVRKGDLIVSPAQYVTMGLHNLTYFDRLLYLF